jgi:hypothetical protein
MADPLTLTYKVVTSRSGNDHRITVSDASLSTVSDDFREPAAGDVTIIGVDALTTTMVRSSVPRGIVAHPTDGTVRLVTEMDMELLALDAELDDSTVPIPTGPSVVNVGVSVADAERAFFTAGEGFVFREPPAGTAAQVDNLSCTTCHPGAHHDGKIHMSAAVSQTAAVVTPSIFDVGDTEWVFFDGLRTIIDIAAGCTYCGANRFFDTTKAFTDGLVGPGSPYTDVAKVTDPAELTEDAAVGRAWFDAMACSRCHQGSLASFPRTNDPAPSQTGPIATATGTADRMLNDRTQVFITFIGGADLVSNRNRTIVGTRPWDPRLDKAVNTPSLAGGWDNRPYMHDGRFATMADVLDNTWLATDTVCGEPRLVSATPWVCKDLGAVPDNFMDMQDVAAGDPLVFTPAGGFNFATHASPAPSGRTSVKSHLTTQGVYDEMIAFLASLSALTDPCSGTAGLAITAPKAIYDAQANETTVMWDTSTPVASELSASWSGGSASWFLDPESHHEFVIDHAADPALEVRLDARLDLCRKVASQVTIDLDGVDTWTAVTPLECDESVLGWHTDIQTGCLLEWGIKNRNGVYTHSTTTGAALVHSVTVPVAPGDRYMARVTPLMPGAASTVFYWNASPCASGGGGLGKSRDLAGVVTGVRTIYPNPFNPSTTVSFGMEQAGQVTVRVYDVSGRLVRTLADRQYPAGTHDLVWNGRDEGGRGVASGTYLVRFETGDLQEVQRIALLK